MSSSTLAKSAPPANFPTNLYEWFNSLQERAAPVTEREVREMWTDDCQMITNGQVKCAGITAFVKHFNEIRDKLKSWQVALPLDVRIEQGNSVGVYYHIDIVMKDGSASRVLVCAFFDIRDGKASKMTEVAYYEGAHLQLDNH